MLSCICGYTLHCIRHFCHLVIKRYPAVFIAVSNELDKSVCVYFFLCLIDILCYVGIVSGANNSFNACTLKAVCEVVSSKQMSSGDCNSAELDKADYSYPELIVTLQHQHNGIAFFYSL